MLSYFVVQSLWAVAMFFSRSFTAQISRCVISDDYKLTSFLTSQEKPEITGQCLRFFLRIISGKLNSFVE